MKVYILRVSEDANKVCRVCGKNTGDYYTKANEDHSKHLIATFSDQFSEWGDFELVEFDENIHAKPVR